MAYQVLQGVQVSPKGNFFLGRFSKSLVDGTWPTSFAFGGWIYNATCDIGYSNQPTEIKINIVLEVSDRAQKYAYFDIQETDLRCDAGAGADENWFNINFNGVSFENFVLHEYETSIENGAKILTVTFKDYSLILDKIYVGLLKRQGNAFPRSAIATLEFPVACPDCLLMGGTFREWSYTTRDLSYGSYVGINGGKYDNFIDVGTENIFRTWEALFAKEPEKPYFDLNGGYLILGTEEATEQRCGDLAPVSYNFNQLLASLRLRGMKFEGAFPKAIKDADFIYHQNYIGSLREVLQQWCSDLGYDFYCQGKTFIGINLNRALDISKVVEVADPTTDFGSDFALNKNTAITSYHSSVSLNNTFKQAVITTNNRARDQRNNSKSPKRYVGILPLHPIDLNRHSTDGVIRYDAFGNWFFDIAWGNDFSTHSSNDRNKVFPELDGRTFGDVDTSIALGRYDQTLRDIFCQDRAIYGETQEIREANFRALGMVPLVELTDEAKAMAIEKLIPEGGDEISNICRDKRFYKVYLGYYYDQYKKQILDWENQAADAMYKYGIIVRGLLNRFPYMPNDSLVDQSPQAGLYGANGTSFMRIQHNIEPGAQQYLALRQAPFKDLILYSGLNTPTYKALPINLESNTLYATGLFYASLNNEWGTTQEHFQRAMSLNLVDECAQQFAQTPDYTTMVNNIPKRYQDWRLELFAPKADADLESMWEFAAVALQNLPNGTAYDRTINTYYNFQYKPTQTCAKLHIMVLTDTRNHPNFFAEFIPQGNVFNNKVMLQQYLDRLKDSLRRRIQTKTPTVCDLSLLQEMCRNLLSGKFQAGPSGDPRYGCIFDEDKYNWFEDGFTYNYLTRPNSRGLTIHLVKNPIRNTDVDRLVSTFSNADINGDFYYTDVQANFLEYESAEMTYDIVYPVNVNSVGGPDGMYYRGIVTSSVDTEYRTPEIVEIFGEPVNEPFNNTTSMKVINNEVDPDLQPQLDPFVNRFLTYMTVISGEDASVIASVEEYHKFIKQINNYELTSPMKTVDLTLAGTPNDFGDFKDYLKPIYGLNKLSLSVSDNGVNTVLSFADRPKTLPRQEAILNKIGPRIR